MGKVLRYILEVASGLRKEKKKKREEMGGGNGMKSKTKRDRNLAKQQAAKGGTSQLAKNKASMNIVCTVCRQVGSLFLCNVGIFLLLVLYLLSEPSFFSFWAVVQSFMCTLSEKSLQEHVNSKHPKSELKKCFTHLA